MLLVVVVVEGAAAAATGACVDFVVVEEALKLLRLSELMIRVTERRLGGSV